MTATLAQSLSFSNTWSLDMAMLASSASSSGGLANSPAWGTMDLFSGANMDVVPDPTTLGSALPVLKVNYPAGSYQSPQSSSHNSSSFVNGPLGGAQFYFRPFPTSSIRALLEYEVFIDNNFQFNQGGKLPGLYGSDGSVGSLCNGGNTSDGLTCWSMRLMWRTNGLGEAYAYFPVSDNSKICQSRNTICSSLFGTSIDRGSFKFTQGQWMTIAMFVQLNNPGASDGSLVIYTDNGQTRAISRGGVTYRSAGSNADDLLVRSVMFSTFFGGHTSDWASPVDTFLLFRNVRLSMANDRIANHSEPSLLRGTLSISWLLAFVFFSIILV
ncbi:hypothetical protein BASA83_002701 [Batrachochytrium salamandrivorans]|nr:hypothetical protein BASA83_002701 [Batrachochytrium salamandrivorans]